MKHLSLWVVALWVASLASAGTLTIIDKKPSGSSGTVEVKCNVTKKVSLTIADTGANDLVSPSGIDFGDVDADGTPGKVPGTPLGDRAQYIADFILSATRSGTGNVTLSARRSVAGNLHSSDGVVIEDSSGKVQSLNGAGDAITVINSSPEGDFNKKLGVTVHADDNGALSSTVQFTLSAL